MKALKKLWVGGLATFGIGYILFLIGLISCALFGFWTVFSASIILGLVSFIIPPSFIVYGICAFFGKDVPQMIVDWLGIPF